MKKIQKEKYKHIVRVMIVFGIAVLVWISESRNPLLKEGEYLIRPEIGEGSYQAELLLEVEGKEKLFTVLVPEQNLTTEEEMRYLEAAVDELEKMFLGSNSSMDEIRQSVVIRTDYQDGLVTAEWGFENPWLIEEDGTIVESELKEDGEEVWAKVWLNCGQSSLRHEFYFKVYYAKKSEEELFYEKVSKLILENGNAEGTEHLLLPMEVDGQSLIWKNKKTSTAIQIFFLGLIVVALFPEIEKQRKKEQREKREKQLLLEYSEMVNKLSLLLGAGMTLQNAWNKITDMYVEVKKKQYVSRSEVYEEMLITRHEIESGKGEIKSYQAFGERCGVQKYRKLSGYLTQNLQKGNYALREILEKEAAEVFMERKNTAQRYGEEAGTKMLLPMLLMLGIVIFIMMVPAVISFQIG